MKFLVVNKHSEVLGEFESTQGAVEKLIGMSTDGTSIKTISQKHGIYSLISSTGWVLAKSGPEEMFKGRVIKS